MSDVKLHCPTCWTVLRSKDYNYTPSLQTKPCRHCGQCFNRTEYLTTAQIVQAFGQKLFQERKEEV